MDTNKKVALNVKRCQISEELNLTTCKWKGETKVTIVKTHNAIKTSCILQFMLHMSLKKNLKQANPNEQFRYII